MLREIDIVIISWAKHDELFKLTCSTIKTLLESEDSSEVKFNIFVVETNNEIVYNYSGTKTLYPEPPYGYNKYCNFGRKQGNAPYVCLCNNDLIFHKNWASEIIRAMEEDSAVMSASPFCPIWHPKSFDLKPNTGDLVSSGSGYGVMGHCIFQRREIYDIIGDLDEQFIHWCADWDYAATLASHKIKNVLVTSSQVTHIPNSTTFHVITAKDHENREKLTVGQFDVYNKKWRKGIK